MKIDWYKIEEGAECVGVVFAGIAGFVLLIGSIVAEDKHIKEIQTFTQKCHAVEGVVIEEVTNDKLVCIPAARLKIEND